MIKQSIANQIVLIDLFSGIGGMHKGLEEAGFNITKCYFSEIDKHAIATYKYNFPNAEYIGSVQNVSGYRIREQHPNERIITSFGWPCQDNSIAGKRKGQRSGTRSGLLTEAGRVVLESKCDNFIAENVKGLSSVNKGYDFYDTIGFLTHLNTDNPQYTLEVQLFNTDWFLPQNRERYYFVGHIGTRCIKRIFPIGEGMQAAIELRGGALNTITARYYGAQATGSYIIEDNQYELQRRPIAVKSATTNGFEIAEDGDSINFSVPKSETRRGRVGRKKLQTIDTHANQAVYTKGNIRRLTEIELERAQGYNENWTQFGNYDGTIKPISKAQRYKQIGNAVSVPIPKAIGKKLLAAL